MNERRLDDRFRQVVDGIHDYAICLLDAGGNVTTWNRGARELYQYAPDEIVGRPHTATRLADDIAAGAPAHELAAAAREGHYDGEGWRMRKDGSRFWANVAVTALRDEAGRVTGFAEVTRDLTERERAREVARSIEARLKLLIDSIHDYAIFMLDVNGIVTSWNPGAERIKQYRADEIIGRHFSVFYPPEAVASGQCERELEIAARDGKFEESGWRVRKDGSQFWGNMIISAMRDDSGKLIGYGKVTRDLTEQLRAEGERMRLMQAQEAIRLRDEFLSIASHELKTPLTTLQLQLHTLSGRAQASDPRLASKLARAARSGDRLATLVEMLLDVSRITTGRLTLHCEEFDLAAAVHDVCERFVEEAARAKTPLRVDVPESIVGTWDRMRIEQVVTNILSNALKYAPGTPVEIEARADGGDWVELVVRDHGPGIAPADAERIFARFERAAPSQNYGGLGLGLYITKQIVEAHGGSVQASATDGGGATFTVRLPRAACDPLGRPG
jgi:PAS domain S-box-containing protein